MSDFECNSQDTSPHELPLLPIRCSKQRSNSTLKCFDEQRKQILIEGVTYLHTGPAFLLSRDQLAKHRVPFLEIPKVIDPGIEASMCWNECWNQADGYWKPLLWLVAAVLWLVVAICSLAVATCSCKKQVFWLVLQIFVVKLN